MKDLLERLREGIRAQAITAAILAILATTAARVDAFDFVLPIPKPSLPSIPLPKFFDEPTRTLSDDDLETIKRAGSVDRGEHARLAEERATPPQDALAPRYSDRLPYCVDLVGYLNIPKSTEPIELCLFRDTQSYTDFIRAVFPGAPLDRPALYVKDSGPGVLMVQRDGNMIVNIRHEMTHAYLNASLKHVPIWIDEGLAKYFETPPGERGFRNPYLKDVEAKASGLFSSPPSLRTTCVRYDRKSKPTSRARTRTNVRRKRPSNRRSNVTCPTMKKNMSSIFATGTPERKNTKRRATTNNRTLCFITS